jgi:cytochrome c553
MTETSEATPIDQATPEELAETIAEFEQYRERLLNETLATAQRAKVMKANAMAQIEPELAKIDAIISQLRQRHGDLTVGN